MDISGIRIRLTEAQIAGYQGQFLNLLFDEKNDVLEAVTSIHSFRVQVRAKDNHAAMFVFTKTQNPDDCVHEWWKTAQVVYDSAADVKDSE